RHRRSLECDRRCRDGRRRRTLLAHELRPGSVSGPNRGPAMHSTDLLYTLSGFCVGALVGMTGVGGGSLMTPVLILLFGVQPTAAVGTDLLYAAITKGCGTVVHGLKDTIDWRIVRRLACGSLPASATTLLLLSRYDVSGGPAQRFISIALGVALLATALAMVFRPRLIAARESLFGEPR